MFGESSIVSLQFTLMLIGGGLALFSTAAFAIIGSFLMREGKWHITAFVALLIVATLWIFAQYALGNNLSPIAGTSGG